MAIFGSQLGYYSLAESYYLEILNKGKDLYEESDTFLIDALYGLATNHMRSGKYKKGKYALEDLTNNPKTGQAIIIINGYVVGIEDLNGTDYMIKKTKKFIKKFSSKRKKQGVLLKFPKKNQDLRIDLPTIGIKTIKDCAKLNLKGIVLKANHNIFLDRIKCINLANKNKMFICAI